nr:hypothetical protein [Tanacetum cinerariifolium]
MSRNQVTIKTIMIITIHMIYQVFLVVITVGNLMKIFSVDRWAKILIFPVPTKFKPHKIVTLNSNQEKEGPPQDSDIHQLIREECCIEVYEKQKLNMENTMLELVEICRQKEHLCMHDNVNDLIESALNFKLLSINSQRPNKEQQEVKNVSHPSYQPKNLNIQLVWGTESYEILKSGVEEFVPILSENEVTLEDKKECDMPVCENSPICDDHSEIFSDSNNDDDISSDDDDFENIEYGEASLLDPEIVSVEEENVVYQEEEEVDLEDISQIQDVILREKLLSINQSDNSLSKKLSPEFETFCDHTEETRSGNTTTHAYNSLPEYDSFCFEIEPDQERLINVVKKDISDDSSNDSLLKEADLFLASDNLIPPGIENFADKLEGDIHFLEALLIDDSIPFPINESSGSESDNLSFPRPPPELPDAEFEIDSKEEILVVMNTIVEFECLDPRVEFDVSNDYSFSCFFFIPSLFFLFSPLRVRILFLTLVSPFRAGGFSLG